VGTLDNKYQIEQLLGKGGMGAVYRATHLGTKRTVAVKVIHPQLSAHDQFVARRLVSEAGWFQLLDVRTVGAVPVVECIRHSDYCDHGVATLSEDAKGGRRVVERCERTV
jgi:serine/threonine protein kinase